MRDLEAAPDLWDQIRLRKDAPASPHTAMSDIWVRYNDIRPYAFAGDFSGINDPHIPIWYPAWDRLPSLKPFVHAVMNAVNGEMLGGVLITRIPAGGRIERHADDSWHVRYFDQKFYLQLQNDPGCRFYAEGPEGVEWIEPKPGDVWRFDNRYPHWVENQSGRDRLTVIICVRTDHFGHQELQQCLGQ